MSGSNKGINNKALVKRRLQRTTLSCAIAATFAGATMQAQAQQAAESAQAAPSPQVVVTGTRVSNRSVLDTASAVDVVSAETLNNVGVTELSQSLANALPARLMGAAA